MICQICNNTNDTNATIAIEEGFRGSRGLAFKLADADFDGRLVGAGARVDNSGVYNNAMPNAHYTLNSMKKSSPPIAMAATHEATPQELTTQTNGMSSTKQAHLSLPVPQPFIHAAVPDVTPEQIYPVHIQTQETRANPTPQTTNETSEQNATWKQRFHKLRVPVVSLDSLYSMMINLIPNSPNNIFVTLLDVQVPKLALRRSP